MSLAQQETKRLHQRSIETEHLLLALIHEREGVAGKVLATYGISLEKARKAVEGRSGRGPHIVLGEIGLTPQARKAIELSVDEARQLNHPFIGTEHLLLGLLREGEGRGLNALELLGISSQEVRARILQIISK